MSNQDDFNAVVARVEAGIPQGPARQTIVGNPARVADNGDVWDIRQDIKGLPRLLTTADQPTYDGTSKPLGDVIKGARTDIHLLRAALLDDNGNLKTPATTGAAAPAAAPVGLDAATIDAIASLAAAKIIATLKDQFNK